MTLELPITVEKIEFEPFGNVTNPFWGGEIGDFVSVRPCAEEYEDKTFLGILVGEIPTSQFVTFDDKTGVLRVSAGMRNPAILVPSLKKVIFGRESWWHVLEEPDQLKQITDDVIDNVWYVQALKAIQEKAAQKAEEADE